MRITGIHATNYQRVQRADIALTAPILLLAGENEQGKTSLADAITHALTGIARRVPQKKDYKQLVHDGQKNAVVVVEVEGDGGEPAAFTVTLPADKRTVDGPIDEQPLLPILLDATRFITMKPEERRHLLFSITGTRVTGKVILGKLKEKEGVNAAKADQLAAVLMAGFAAAHDEAKTKASEARGAWKALTGEVYGSKKAETWKAPKPEYDASKIPSLQASITQERTKAAEIQHQLGAIDEKRRVATSQQNRRRALVDLIDLTERRKAKLDADQALVDEWTAKVAETTRLAGDGPPAPTMTCPDCGAMVELHAGSLHKHEPGKAGDPAAIALLPGQRQTLERVTRVRDTAKAEHEASLAAKVQLKELDEQAGEAVDEEEATTLRASLQAHQSSERALQATLDALLKDKAAADAADTNTAKALAHHTDVIEWEAVQGHLAPSGIQTELLTAAMTPFNDRLAETAQRTGWPLVSIDPDMNILIGGRVYSLCSASAKWRAQAALVEAISHISKVKTFMLDEVEILIGAQRMAFLKWMHGMATLGEIDTAIIIGSFKEKPGCPPTFNVEWVQAGTVGAPQTEEAAA